MRKIKHQRKELPKVSLFKRALTALGRILITPAVFSSLGILLLATWFYASGEFNTSLKALKQAGTKTSQHLDLTLKDVYLEGQHYTPNEDILQALNVEIGQPLLSINIEAIKNNIERLHWVDYAIVERLYPSTLSIHIVERKPIAFWQHNGAVHLIDSYGKVIEENDFVRFKDLIIIVGEDIALHATPLLTMLSEKPELYTQVSSATRIGGRRWDIKLHNDITINLPEKNAGDAWAYLAQLQKENTILNQANHYIDLRIEGKMFIK